MLASGQFENKALMQVIPNFIGEILLATKDVRYCCENVTFDYFSVVVYSPARKHG
jgi:hypothetical protein